MTRWPGSHDKPLWLDLISHPGVVEVIAALYNHGPASFDSLRAYVELDGSGHHTATALRQLAAWRICRRSGASGSWDQSVPAPDPETVYELTDFGLRFAETMVSWRTVVDQMPPELRRSLRRRR